MIIAIEGIDGSGKSTVANALSEYFEGCKVWHQPNDNLRDYIGLVRKSVHYLWYLHEMGVKSKSVSIYHSDDEVLILDRWFWSTIAYQGASFECALNRVELMDAVLDGPFAIAEPDIIFYLKVDGDVAETRRNQRGEKDGYDKASRPFFNAVEDHYEWLVKQPTDSKVVVIDGNQPFDVVMGDVVAAYEEYRLTNK